MSYAPLDRRWDLLEDEAEPAPRGYPGRVPVTARLAPRAITNVIFRVADPANAAALDSTLGVDPAAAARPLPSHGGVERTSSAPVRGARADARGTDDPFGLHLIARAVAPGAQPAAAKAGAAGANGPAREKRPRRKRRVLTRPEVLTLAQRAARKAAAATAAGSAGKDAPASARAVAPTASAAATAPPAAAAPAGAAPAKVMRAVGEAASSAPSNVAAILKRADGSATTPLPAELRARFEQSTGKDLGDVILHTGPESDEAARSVGARAYAAGQHVHFAAGQYAPGTESGDRLIAHEVFHTLQAPRAATSGTVETSAPGDHAEHEADDAANAMVSGDAAQAPTATEGRIHRDPGDNSYNRGELSWGGGTALKEDEYRAWAAEQAGYATAVMTLVTKTLGWSVPGVDDVIERLKADASAQYDVDVYERECAIATLEDQIEYLEDEFNGWWEPTRSADQDAQLARYQARLEQEEKALDLVENGRETEMERVARNAAVIAGAVNDFSSTALSIGSSAATLAGIDTSMFESLEDARGKIAKVGEVASLAQTLLDRSALNSFMANPDLETAEAWGNHIGEAFEAASFLAEGLPPGWSDVIGGMMKLPKLIANRFAKLVKKRYQDLDRGSRDHGKSETPDEGSMSET